MFHHPILKFIFSVEVITLLLLTTAGVLWFYYSNRAYALLCILIAIAVILLNKRSKKKDIPTKEHGDKSTGSVWEEDYYSIIPDRDDVDIKLLITDFLIVILTGVLSINWYFSKYEDAMLCGIFIVILFLDKIYVVLKDKR